MEDKNPILFYVYENMFEDNMAHMCSINMWSFEIYLKIKCKELVCGLFSLELSYAIYAMIVIFFVKNVQH